MIYNILKLAIENKATDLHLKANNKVWIRKLSKLLTIDNTYITDDDLKEIFNELLTDKNKQKEFNEIGSTDFGFTNDLGNFRGSFYKQNNHLALAIRILPSIIPSITDLGLPNIFYDLIKNNNGLILVTGATGNGKSTTLASLINEINKNEAKHIITIEDPIEYRYNEIKSLISQREIGTDCSDFYTALTSALRQDPDIILVGEMRDKDTIRVAIQAAETGHLVLSTLHTNSAATSIERIMSSFEDEEQLLMSSKLANCLRAIISQVLISYNNKITCAYELLLPIPSIKNMIRENKHHHISSFMQVNKQTGIITLEDSLKDLYKRNLISLDDAINCSNNPDYLKGLLKITK